MIEPVANRPFSLTRGGWFYELLHRIRITDRRGRVRWVRIVAVLWLPMMLASLVRLALGGTLDAVVLDPSVHVRLLLSVPLVVLAESLLEVRCAEAAQLVRQERLVERTNIDSILSRAEHLARSRIAETTFAVAAIIGGQAVLWGLIAPGGLIHGSERETAHSFATFWYATLAVPLLQLLVLRFLWRWAIWTYVLVRLARLSLATNALHPDKAAGLRFLSNPIDAFALFVSANLIVVSAAWAARVQYDHVPVQSFFPNIIGFILIAVAATCGPLLLFSPQIYRARHHDVERYHAVAYELARDFRRKWMTSKNENVPRSQHTLLGSGDFSSLADLGSSFMTADATRALAFGGRTLLIVGLGAMLPMLPLVLATVPASEILKHIGKMLQLPLT